MEASRTRTILVVDDAAMFRELGSLFLSRIGRVIPAADGEEGLFLARRHRPDVILLDLVMPGMDGTEVCRRLREDPELGGTPIVILTASPLGEDHERAIMAGADQVISKPISRVALIDAVNRYLHSPISRGMPRVSVETPVRISHPDGECEGVALNLSRGGMFVESDGDAPSKDDVSLEFSLPETARLLTPTARIVWRRGYEPPHPTGLGLRFMRLDGDSARDLSQFVHEHYANPL
ncbi:MAG: response regulator [Myxococcota bacterium]